MRLYLDNEYNSDFRNLLKTLHSLDYKADYEIVDGKWLDSYSAADTIVFLSDDAKVGLTRQTLSYYEDGYRVFAWRKPFGRGLNVYRQALIILSQWKKILDTINKEQQPFIYGISEAKAPLNKMFPKRPSKIAHFAPLHVPMTRMYE